LNTLSHRLGAHSGIKATRRTNLRRKLLRSRKRLIRTGLLAANVALLVVAVGFVVKAPTSSQALKTSLNAANSDIEGLSGPLDQLSSADIAVNVARMASLPEATAVANHADSVSVKLSASSPDNNVIAKPQVIGIALPSLHDIQIYVTKEGDTISSLARKFEVSSDSIRWSNGLTNDQLTSDLRLYIPPPGQNGIVYKVKPGDTPKTLAEKYAVDKNLIISFNDAEIDGLKPGTLILIPNGTVSTPSYSVSSFAFYGSTSAGYNSYEWGWCTWYVASKLGTPGGWGNANTWDDAARLSGWSVSSIPKVGAIAQTDGGWLGHVGVVEAVSADGTSIKYSDMNGLAGWGSVGYSGWEPSSKYEHYIYR
jgi:N-acetylmuramoyl-L-alanine amidase